MQSIQKFLKEIGKNVVIHGNSIIVKIVENSKLSDFFETHKRNFDSTNIKFSKKKKKIKITPVVSVFLSHEECVFTTKQIFIH